MTAVTVVCCSMISLSQTLYGSGTSPGSARHGSRRRWRSYKCSRSSAGGMEQDKDTVPDIAERSVIRIPPRPFFAAGLRPVGSILPSVARKVYRKQTPAAAQIQLDWEVIVGPKVASMTVPRRLDRGTLTIACSGAAAMNLHYVGQELINRINTHLGGQPVQTLRFTQAGMPKPPRVASAA